MSRRVGYGAGLGAAITWGISYTINQKLLVVFSPLVLMVVGSIVTLMICAPLVAFGVDGGSLLDVWRAPSKTQWLLGAELAVGLVAEYLIYMSIQRLGAGRASIIEITYPVFVVFFCWLAYKDQITSRFALGALLVLVGSALVVGEG